MRPLVGSALRLVWEAGKRESFIVLLMVTLQGVGVSVLLLQVAKLAGGLIDAEGGAEPKGVPQGVAVFLLANALVVISGIVVNNRRLMLAERTALYAQRQILDVAVLAELDDFDDAGFHDRLQRAAQNARNRPMMLVEAVIDLVRSSLMLVGVAAALVIIEPWIGFFVLAAIVPIWRAGIRSGQQYFEFVVETTQGDRTRRYLFELLTSREAAKEVRAFDLGPHVSTRWSDLMDDRLGALLRTIRKRFRQAVLASVGSNAIIAAVAVVLIWLTRRDIMTLAEAATTAGALMIFTQKLMDLVQGTNMFFEAAPLIRDLQDFLDLKPSLLADRPTQLRTSASFDRIDVDHISFAYKGSDRSAIDGVSLTINAGEVVAIVGENGSGKTTLTKLLGGLYPTDAGQILIDGVDIADIDPASWRAQIAVVFQDYLHYALTARENIHVGAITTEASEDALRAAARAAGADDFLTALPKGYETILSPQFDHGQDLSLGQWQRVALARAFFRSAPLVVLDEPTASLDARAEKALFDTVRDLYHGRTVVLISHRFSTVRNADRIVVLEAGKVVEHGTHEELMRADGLYAELFTMQASSYLDLEGEGDGNGDGLATPAVGETTATS